MSYRLQDDAFSVKGCKSNTKFVLVTLAKYANDMTGECYPSHRTIASIVGISRQSVVEKIQELVSLGYITKSPRRSGFIYKITIPQSSAASSSDKIQQVADKGVSDNPTGSVEKSDNGCRETRQGVSENPTGGVGKPDTNKEYNIENIKETTNIDKQTKVTESVKSNNGANLMSSVVVGGGSSEFEDIRKDAFARLKKIGFAEDVVDKMINAVLSNFKREVTELRDNGYQNINNRHNYLVGMLVNMAKERPKTTVVAKEEPKSVDGILSVLEDEFKKEYPKQAHKMSDIINSIPDRLYRRLKAQEENGWPDCKRSRVGMVRSMITEYVENEVSEYERVDRESKLRDLEGMRRSLVNKKAELIIYKQDGLGKELIAKTEDAVARAQTNIDRLTKELEDAG